MIKYIKILIFLILILGSIAVIFHGRWLDTLPQKYTTGQIKNIYKPAKGGMASDYVYKIEGNQYTKTVSLEDYLNSVKEGDKFLVEVPNGYPNQGAIKFDKIIPDSLEAPEEGWDELPEFVR